MTEQTRSNVIKSYPLGNGLDAFRASFHRICDENNLLPSPNAVERFSREGNLITSNRGRNVPLTTKIDLQNCVLILLSALQTHPAARHLRSRSGKTLFTELSRLNTLVTSDDFDFDCITPLIRSTHDDTLDDAVIWGHVLRAVTEPTPPPRPVPSSIQQTPLSQNTSGLVNSSEFRQGVDIVLKAELEPLYAGIPHFHKTFFGDVPYLDTVSQDVFRRCSEGDNPLFRVGWNGWPTDAQESDVLAWFRDLIPKLEALADDRLSSPSAQRKLLAQPKTPLEGSTSKRSMDIGFISDNIKFKPDAADSRYRWSHILVAGELKRNPKADTSSTAWIDLARYAREVLAAQDTRRFVLGFTLCGSLMRVWEFDRLGGIASERFDINKEDGALQFVTTILGFLRMNEELLGFDPTIVTSGDRQYIEIERNDVKERLVIDEVMQRARCVAGRATTCWKAHPEGDPQTLLVIKDSWQYTDRDEEGELLREATHKGVAHVARYYHHMTVRIRDAEDDIRQNVRRGLDITKATNHRPGVGMQSSSVSAAMAPRQGRSTGAGAKRPSSETGSSLPPSKRCCSTSSLKAGVDTQTNRVHRRVIIRDYGKPIYSASTHSKLLVALEHCIDGHQSLYKAGFLHRDISVNNLMINEEEQNPSLRAFLIDLDLAIRTTRVESSGARGKTGTRAFMAIGALLGEEHSFMHDLESFFWVLFWICIHYDGPAKSRVVTRFEKWNYVDTEELAGMKLGVVAKEAIFLKTTSDNVTEYYAPLIPVLNKLRKVVFPGDKPWDREDERLYSQMTNILQRGR